MILASGSTPIELSIAPFDGEYIVDSWGALEFTEVPKTLGVVGAGVIGLELGSVWNRLGSNGTILEAMEDFLSMADKELAKDALRHFRKQGLKIQLGAKVTSGKASAKSVTVNYEDKDGSQSLDVDKLVVAVGRRPFTDGLFTDDAGVLTDERGFIEVDQQCRTSIKGVFAVGD